jgi:hypothetical protein
VDSWLHEDATTYFLQHYQSLKMHPRQKINDIFHIETTLTAIDVKKRNITD